MNLNEMRDYYIASGIDYQNATARACQDAFLELVAASGFADQITLKGGVVIQRITGDNRRATQDIDFDFMRYSIADDSIRSFIAKLNRNSLGILLQIKGGIVELKHQDYHGKRVNVVLADAFGTEMLTSCSTQ